MKPRKAIIAMCKECVSGNLDLCVSPDCKLYSYRKRITEGKPALSPLKAIKAHCYECTSYETQETKNCTDKVCALYPFRLGRNPFVKGGKGMSAEHMKRIRPFNNLLKMTNEKSIFRG